MLYDHADLEIMRDALGRVYAIVERLSDSDNALTRAEMAELRGDVDLISDNITSPVVDNHGNKVAQEDYDAAASSLDALRRNVEAVLWDLARRSDSLRTASQMDTDLDWLCCYHTVDEVTDFVERYLEPVPAPTTLSGSCPRASGQG